MRIHGVGALAATAMGIFLVMPARAAQETPSIAPTNSRARWDGTGPDHLPYDATIEDPRVFSRPWKIRMPLYRRLEPNIQLLDYECQAYLEAEKDRGR